MQEQHALLWEALPVHLSHPALTRNQLEVALGCKVGAAVEGELIPTEEKPQNRACERVGGEDSV